MTTKTQVAIIAGVSFALHNILAGAFNSHHKARLAKADGKGQVTKEGAVYFSNRKRLSLPDLQKRIAELPGSYKLLKLPAGFSWAVNPQGAYYQAGQGEIGQSLFAYALSDLTQAAAKAAEKAKAKPAETAKPKAAEKAKAAEKVEKPKAAAKPAAAKPKAAQVKVTA